MPKRLSLGAAAMTLLIAGLFPFAAIPQSNPRGKSHTLFGTVEGINEFAQSIRVVQEQIKGYSDARAPTYNVDDVRMLKKLEIGDRIVAMIYEKDDTLYDIRVVQINDANPVPIPPQRPPR